MQQESLRTVQKYSYKLFTQIHWFLTSLYLLPLLLSLVPLLYPLPSIGEYIICHVPSPLRI